MPIEDAIHAASMPYSASPKELVKWGSRFRSNQLPFTMELQEQSNWCWAATAKSVSHFFWYLSPWRQCTIVNAELNRTDACSAHVPAGANIPWYLDRALSRTNNFVSIAAGQATFGQIRAEIDAGRPLGARIGWNNGGGHFMVIYGYSTWLDQRFVDIDDPISGKSHLTLEAFSTNYQGSGSWTHYYFLKSYSRWWWPKLVPIPEPVFKKIWEARELMRLKSTTDPDHAESTGSTEEPRFGLAHRVYALGLDDLLSKRKTEPQQIGLRIYESLHGSPVAFYDVDEAGEGAVHAMSESRAHLDAFSEALSAAERTMAPSDDRNGSGDIDEADGGEDQAEARLLRVPALNFEGIWVIDRQGQSLILPLRSVGRLETGHSYAFDEALSLLSEAAQPLADMDDTMGA